jgi:predicted phage-related endonuclease
MKMNAPTTRDRQSFLGGTDAPAVLGVSQWMTPVDLWRLKTGRAKQEPNEQRDRRLARGKKLEPFICDMVVEKLRDEGHDVQVLARNERYTDPEHAFLSCEIDMELLVDGEHCNTDAKSVGGQARHKWGQEGTDEIPIDYPRPVHGRADDHRPPALHRRRAAQLR